MSAERLAAGERVRVRADFPPGHVRTPVYVRGKTGVVTHRFGAFANPEQVAYRLTGPDKILYQVRFRQADLWPDYSGPDTDTVDIDLYDHWLEKV
jgi:nitrile hydratase subunit beta